MTEQNSKFLRNLNHDINDPLENLKGGGVLFAFTSTILCFPFLPLLVCLKSFIKAECV